MHGFYSRAELEQIANQIIGARLPGQGDQLVTQVSATQKFEIGARKRESGRIFRYSYAVADLTLAAQARLVANSNYAPEVTGHVNEDGFMGNITFAGVARTAVVPAGSTYLDIADTALRAADWYQGGYVIIFDDVTPFFHQYGIIASNAGTGTYVRIYLDHPVAAAIPVNNAGGNPVGITAYRSPYSAVAPAGSVQTGFEPLIGMTLCGEVPSGYYFWLLTAGPIWITPTGVTWPGSAANLRDIYANPADGTIQPPTISNPSDGFQRIGYLLPATGGTSSDYGDAWIMLQLDQ